MGKAEELIDELSKERKNIKTDSYSMSIGEIISLYKENDLILNPAFQRLFRWDDEKKSKFIESILIGIPIPEIFVAQDEQGTWTIVDGVQRLSTLLQLTGDLESKEPLTLTETKYLPSLKDMTWSTLPTDVQRVLKRSKLGINIILTENSIQAQYELFQRLNTGGIHLEDQEIRNCLMIMLNETYYDEINQLKNYSPFKDSLSFAEKRFEKEEHMELIIRYFIAKHNSINYEDYVLSNLKLSDFIDDQITRIISDDSFNLDEEILIFKRVFKMLHDTLGNKCFKKYKSEKNDFEGQFMNANFEAIVVGVAQKIDEYEAMSHEDLIAKIASMHEQKKYIDNTERGVRAVLRFKGLTEFSREFF